MLRSGKQKFYLSLAANNIKGKLTNQLSPTRQTTLSIDSDDDFRSTVVETSVTGTDNSPFQDFPHPAYHTTRSTVTPGFKLFTV